MKENKSILLVFSGVKYYLTPSEYKEFKDNTVQKLQSYE